ncbi:1,4-dihydroxy-2-naphthoate polyprenyltransferase [Bacillus sp. L381]|jgi:1,4-dihydroxy-2-naphthoate octaprenyltransferase|uniref:1,4-dihydroxy-2-naphthoate octaprenyltransferase n=2 Tax=Bacillus amyloliquefaciens TaxID=1390 RepID=A0A9P1JKJ0_BACAS|nr:MULTISPECIES: 1,4-dihydroxy-2-naphthoate polyprenyltransferase [Bacillus]AIW35656.1 1,4-dihydroxy-2-naphthoate octaprenyltransferase [Bacillus subtilis]AEB26042.1 1, 4-dihydroxy-2-naphthoateoctaprenyltransferase [Bacillus amyloliquefaciens TA208]AEB65520.1 1, 4-dihydroxy-2-naphthoateoctaprenyltransferase [Bacillus amyloliquefaciens LL3]AEK91099.1 1,4-dihydroxy-2-naphthoate [Bacillus amyloliquefaciens XH7]ARW41040.1 1,4-dihydroxy-2-naphthoate octaprenyltransferase [Bacillus amyloliquefaciens
MNQNNMGGSQKTPEKESMGRILWQLTRPHTLTASFVPVLLGTVLAMFYVKVDFLLFLAMLFSCLWIQIATNLFNEYYDFKRGLDTEDSVGIGGAIVRHGMKPKTILQLALGSYAIALVLGVYICMSSSWWLAAIGLAGMLIGYLYTGGPLPIAYTPFGELFSGICMGSVFVLISFFIQTGEVNEQSILISIPIAILVGAINLSNNIRDIEEDKKGGRKTLAILMGHRGAVIILAASFAIAYIWIVGLVIMGYTSPWLFLVFLSVPKPIQAVKGFVKNEMPMNMIIAMKSTAQTNTFFGFLLSIGLLISYFR